MPKVNNRQAAVGRFELARRVHVVANNDRFHRRKLRSKLFEQSDCARLIGCKWHQGDSAIACRIELAGKFRDKIDDLPVRCHQVCAAVEHDMLPIACRNDTWCERIIDPPANALGMLVEHTCHRTSRIAAKKLDVAAGHEPQTLAESGEQCLSLSPCIGDDDEEDQLLRNVRHTHPQSI